MPRSLARVLLLQSLRRTRSAPGPRCAAPRAGRSRRRSQPCRFPMPAGSTPTAIPTQIRRRPTWPPGCRRQANFPSRSSTRQIDHGADKGCPGGPELDHLEVGRAEHRRRDARDRRGRQRLRRPLLHPRLRCPQRRLPRRHPRCRRQRPRELFHRTGRDLPRSRLVLCRPRHHRRRDQHRDQAGDDREKLLQHGHHVRHRPHQAGRARRQPGDQPDAGDSRGRPVPGRRRCRPRLHQGRPRRRLRSGKVDAARHREALRELHSHQSARLARFRRAVLPARVSHPGNTRPLQAARIPISAPAAAISTASSTATITASSRTSERSAARLRSPRI